MEKERHNFFCVARKLLEYARHNEKHVASEELDAMWLDVERRVIAEKRTVFRHRIIYFAAASSVAAVFICVFWISGFFMPHKADGGLVADISQCVRPETVTDEILLLIPGYEGFELTGKNPEIVCSSDGYVIVDSDTLGVQAGNEGFSQLITPKGRRTGLTLADGTRMWVNAGTRVVYPGRFGKDGREIYVEGEVYLDVFHNEDAPFTVRTKDFNVRVLGTSFNVSAYPSGGVASVVLVEGSVNVRDMHEEQVRLEPGQLVDVRTGQLGAPRDVDVRQYVCWVDNMLLFSDESLENVFRKLDLYYDKEFVLESGVAQMLVSGKLDLKENLEDVLHVISYSAPISYEEDDGRIYVKKR